MCVNGKTIILGPIISRFVGRLPNKFKLFFGFSEVSLLGTNAREEERFKTHSLEEFWCDRGVAKGVD